MPLLCLSIRNRIPLFNCTTFEFEEHLKDEEILWSGTPPRFVPFVAGGLLDGLSGIIFDYSFGRQLLWLIISRN
jgi:hypothetical protein